MAFGKFASDGDPLNRDFYGDPGDRIVRMPGYFVFHLGGQARHQIGIKVASHPELIAALDTRRSLLIVRKTSPQEGFYFNIADNDQTAPVDSAARIGRRVASLAQRMVRLPASYHLVTIDVERDRVADEVATFFERRLGPAR